MILAVAPYVWTHVQEYDNLTVGDVLIAISISLFFGIIIIFIIMKKYE
jgi:hypothetical protein